MKASIFASVVAYVLFAHAAPRDELTPYEGKCRESTRAICAQSSKLSKGDPSLNNVTGKNYERCTLDSDYWIADTDAVLKPFDAVYNGTSWMEARPVGNNGCSRQSQNSTYQYQLRVGSTGRIEGTNRTRSEYDANPFYLFLTYFNPRGAWDNSTSNQTTAGNIWIVSSQSFYEYGQHWTLNSTKNGDGWDIAGELTTHKYADNLGLWYRIGNCANFYKSWEYKTSFLIKDCNAITATLTGRLTPERAELKITTQTFSQPGNPEVDFYFSGTANSGPKLVLSQANPVPDGKNASNNGTNGAKKNDASGHGFGHGSWLAGALALAALMAFL
ncbi:hypothetical protein B0J11DRAFT_183829 [Dendryphion nanum]|uniref:Uncharacterized protein n=1 Tax=Dendryphion nanum TaxID=256645 RepID=A0A9P9D3N8_9PLEO|nr:hypothetical protein B0J11DRAFT_183829 [Dendryphion nanum]